MTHVMDHLGTMAAGTPLGRHVSVDQRGCMRRYILCHSCGYLSLSEDRFASLQVPIKGCTDLTDALRGMTQPEVLSDDNQYSCPGCSSLQDASMGRYFDGEPAAGVAKQCPRTQTWPARHARALAASDTVLSQSAQVRSYH